MDLLKFTSNKNIFNNITNFVTKFYPIYIIYASRKKPKETNKKKFIDLDPGPWHHVILNQWWD